MQVDEDGFGEAQENTLAPDPIIPSSAGPNQWRLPEESLGLGLLAGALAGVAGAAIWALVSVASHQRVGYIALGIGFAVGWVVRKAGHGTSWPFGAVAAILTVSSCVLGMVSGHALRTALGDDAGFSVQVLERLLTVLLTQPLVEAVRASVNPVDGVFTLVATYQAFQLGYTRLSKASPEALP